MASCRSRLSSGIILRAYRRKSLFLKDASTSSAFSTYLFTSSFSDKRCDLLLLRERLQRHCACDSVQCTSRRYCQTTSDSNASGNTGTTEKTDSSPGQASSQQQKTKKPSDRILRVTPAPKQQHPQPPSPSPSTISMTQKSPSATAAPNITIANSILNIDPSYLSPTKLITPVKAKSEYCLTDEHLKDLKTEVRRNPVIGQPPIPMYRLVDVIWKASAVHGSMDKLEAARARAKSLEFVTGENADAISDSLLSLLPPPFTKSERNGPSGDQKATSSGTAKKKGIGSAAWHYHGTERVVLAAVAVNTTSLIVKLGAWWYTGSNSLMAESLHSLADTMNQILVAYGVHQSLRKPDKLHPYGYSNVRYVTSLISGIGIFYIGSAMSLYHGVRGLWLAAPLESLPVGLIILAIAFCGDGVTFLMARRTIRSKAATSGMTPSQYVRMGEDPSLSVVYLEDRAALYGCGIAIASLSLSFYLNSHIPDSIGSILIGLILFRVAYRIIRMNIDQLLGKSIPVKEIEQISRTLEADPVVRSIQDIKATELGAGEIRFKAEIDFDGKSITRSYLQTVDLQKTLEEAKSLKTTADLEQFLMKHGEGITDRQGAEIDRIEQELKKKFPDIRHVDLEAL